MRKLTTKDVFTFMPTNVRHRIADEIRKGNTNESMRAHLDAVKAINDLNAQGAQKEQRIVDAVCLALSLDKVDVLGKSRTAAIVEARQLAMALMRFAGMSYSRIGMVFGRDHTTAMHGVAVIQKRIAEDYELRRIVRSQFPDYAKSIQSKAGAA